MSRAYTLVLALLILHLLLGPLCLVVARGERRSEALRLWGLGLLTYAAGLAVTIVGSLPVFVSKVAGNALIALAPILSIRGALSYTGMRLDRRSTWAAYAVTVGVIAANHLREPYSVLVDLLAPAPLANLLFAVGAFGLVRRPPADARNAARFVAGVFVSCIAVWTVRMLVLWLAMGGANDRERADLTVSLFVIAQMVIVVAATLGLLWIEVRQMQAELERVAFADALTGLPNRRATLARFREELARASRHGTPLALAVLDVDRFKDFNDRHGHLAGDAVLAHVGRVLQESSRREDVLGRLGGEEFVVLLPGYDAVSATETAARLARRVAESPVQHEGAALAVTLSGGVASVPDDGRDWDTAFAAADKRLYAAKQSGRNRVEGPARAS
jgi:diguanylate cyclase (GGDEF)-like protein